MDVGIGLPNPIRGVRGHDILEWARRAEAAGFHGLSTIDRLAYPSHEPLLSLAAAAAVTERIGLFTDILIAPLRPAALIAKEALTLDRLSGGRLTLGLGVGGRADDFEAVHGDFSRRGGRMDAIVGELRQAFAGAAGLGPEPVRPGGPPILFGGTADATLRRVVERGAGWTSGGAPPQVAAAFAERVRKGWAAAERSGQPRLAALAYFALGPDADAQAARYLGDYYAFAGDRVSAIVAGAARSPAMVGDTVRAFEAAGFDELYFDPTSGDPEQVDRLAETLA